MTKILVVSDNEQLGRLLLERLERRGRIVILSDEAREALASAKASQPDVIVLDAPLRGDDDWATARAFKFDDHTRDIPLICLLANNSEEARALAIQNGCDALQGKPIDFAQLLQQIDAALNAPDAEDGAES